ncbi:MAG: TrmH family RNA methyltransferase [Eubacteriales bacterium]
MFHIVLVEPEIPQNTGNIARTCAVTEQKLYPCARWGSPWMTNSSSARGTDYWHELDITHHDSFEELRAILS